MSDVLSRELPAPKFWQQLENLAFDVYRRLWETSDAHLHGRRGQPQAGVDVYGTDRVEGRFTGVQCKGKDGDLDAQLTERELRDEVAKALTFQPPLEVYILLTSAPDDFSIQRVAREISAEHKKAGLFEVRVTGWGTFKQYVTDHQDVLIKYYRDFAPMDVAAELASATQQNAQSFAQVAGMLRSQNRVLAGIGLIAEHRREVMARANSCAAVCLRNRLTAIVKIAASYIAHPPQNLR